MGRRKVLVGGHGVDRAARAGGTNEHDETGDVVLAVETRRQLHDADTALAGAGHQRAFHTSAPLGAGLEQGTRQLGFEAALLR